MGGGRCGGGWWVVVVVVVGGGVIRFAFLPVSVVCSPYNIRRRDSNIIVNVHKSQVTELRSCAKVEVAVLGSPFLISLTVSGDVKQQ